MSLRSARSLRSMMLLGLLGGLASPSACAPPATAPASAGVIATNTPAASEAVSAAVEKARAFAFQNTHAPLSPLGKFAAAQLLKSGQTLGVPAEQLQNPKVAFHGAFVKAVTSDWVYQFNAAGEQTIRPLSNVPLMASELGRNNRANPLDTRANVLEAATRALFAGLGCQNTAFKKVVKKQEVLFVAECKNPSATLQSCAGRSLIRLVGDDDRYFQVIFGAEKPVRIDTNIRTASLGNADKLLFQQIQQGPGASSPVEYSGSITLGTFFDPSEYRFENEADSYEGMPCFDATLSHNPYKHNDFAGAEFLLVNGHFDTDRSDLVEYRAWANTQDGKYWLFDDGVCASGREGGARGTFDPKTQNWFIPNVSVTHHALKDYHIVGGEPTTTKSFVLSDNKEHVFPYAERAQLEPKFYQDLEACNVASFSTHGGPLDGTLGLRRGLDVWFKLKNDGSKFGSGNLRTLLLNGCEGIDCFRQHDNSEATLFTDWLPAQDVEGLQTICALDGEAVGAGVGGFRFFHVYNEDQSISESWWMGNLRECDANSPVTVSYGATRDAAINTLSDGRFSKDKVTPNFVAASVWKNM